MPLIQPYKLAAGSILKYKIDTSIILLLISIFLGLCYLILSGYAFITALLLCSIIILGLIKPEYTYYILLPVLVEEMVHFFVTIPPIYQVRIYPYFFPLILTMLGIMVTKIVRKEHLVHTPVDAILWIIVTCELISVAWSPNLKLAIWLSLFIISNLILFHVITNIVINETIIRRSVYVLILGGIITSTAIILSQWIELSKIIYLTNRSGFNFQFGEQVDRPAGLGGVDHVAGFVSISLFLALGSMVYERRWKVKAIYCIIILYMFTGIILTTARGVVIGVSVAYLFFISIHSHFRNKFIKYLFIFFCVSLFLVLLVKPGFIDRMLIGFGYTGDLMFSEQDTYSGTEASTSEGEGLSGLEMRKIWWLNGLNEMLKHPIKIIFGLGTGGFLYYSKGYNTVCSPEVNSVSFAFFYDLGVFGAILLIILVYLIISNIYYYLKNAKKGYCYYILLASTAFLLSETGVHGLIDYDLNSYGSKYFWFPLAFTMAVLNVVKAENNHEKSFSKDIHK